MQEIPTAENGTPGNKMSSSLKERLKRCGRYHSSPVAIDPAHRQHSHLQHMQGDLLNSHSASIEPDVMEYKQEEQCHTDMIKSKQELDVQVAGKIVDEIVHVEKNIDVNHHISDESKNVNSTTKNGHSKVCVAETSNDISDSHNVTLTDQSSMCLTPNAQKSKSNIHMKRQVLKFAGSIVHDTGASQDDTSISVCKPVTDIAEPGHNDAPAGCGDLKIKLEKQLEQRQELLRKLKMVKMYRTKNNLSELETLIGKWRDVSQQAVQDLHDGMPEPRPTLTQLIDHLAISHELIHFNPDDDETFS